MPKYLLPILFLNFYFSTNAQIPDSKRAADIRERIWPKMEQQLHDKYLTAGNPMFIRIIKEESILEIWIKGRTQYNLFKKYPVCYFSGGLGTKTKINDGKSPEGFYTITPKQLNPVSGYHLAMNVGYPNELERSKGYTGNEIMIHGNCASIGCYAMTDELIEEIYTLAYQTFAAGQQSIPVYILPFKLTTAKLSAYMHSPYYPLWSNMKPGYDLFEKYHVLPDIKVENGQYAFAMPAYAQN